MTEKLYTSTLILCRLFCEPAGEGMVLLKVPAGMPWLAARVCQEDCYSITKGKWIFAVANPDAVRASRDIGWVPNSVLRADAPGLADLFVRSIVSGGAAVRPLKKAEFEKLDAALGHWGPEWRPYVPVEG